MWSAVAPLAASAAVLSAAAGAPGSPITYSGSQATLAAAATFDTQGTDLTVTLTNTSAADVLVPADVLTAVFFQVSGATLLLTPTSAVVPPTSSVLFGAAGPGGNVGGEWAYRGDLTGAPGGLTYGISSAGFGHFGPQDRFPGANLHGPESPGGLEYGILSAGDNPATGNTPVTGSQPLIRNEVVFRLGGLPAGFDPSTRISAVTFQYGTDTGSEPSFPGIPAPGTMALAFAAGACCMRRRR
ncbi:MAG: XDD4 family exosortase-dependent surface protein [Phycisphaerales bacterium]